MLDLAHIVRRAWERGADIDLAGAGYGRIHWDDKTKIATNPLQYYPPLPRHSPNDVRHDELAPPLTGMPPK